MAFFIYKPSNLENHDRLKATFTWSEAEKQLDCMCDGGLNIGHEAINRHAKGTLFKDG